MATQITKYTDAEGKEFPTELEAIASDIRIKNKAVVDEFVGKHFPVAEGKQANPHASTATKAIYLWIAQQPPIVM